MSLYAEDKGSQFERTPPGMHLARCYRIIDLGTQKSEYMGQVKYQHKIMIGWEVHAIDDDGKPVFMQDGRPFAIFKNYTLSWSDKANLRLDLQSWRGKPFTKEEMRKFDLANVLGAWCMLNVIEREGQNNNIYSNVNGITPVPGHIKQIGLPEPVNKNELFNISEPNMEMFETFSQKLKEKIEQSPEWQNRLGDANAQAADAAQEQKGDPDYIPF